MPEKVPSVLPEVHVAVGVIIRDGRVLIARRPEHAHQGGLLEFPGGKVEPGETVQQALVREIAEETGLKLIESALQPVIGIRHNYGDKRVFLDVWSTDAAAGEAHGREGQPIRWLLPQELRDADFPAANRSIIRALQLPSQLALTGSDVAEGESGLKRLKTALQVRRPPLIVLRAPALTEQAVAYNRLAQSALVLCQSNGSKLMLHGVPELMDRHPQAAGVHLPWRHARQCQQRPVAECFRLGVSCHNAEQLAHAAAIGADYATLGHVLDTPSHPNEAPLGWCAFSQLVSAARLPVYGIGGLSPTDLPQARQCGAQGIAGIGFWWS
ncbi:Nudix family hydrolase [Marinobacter sp. M3C]|jgi:8-oxo-dGTP diphosphatase|uniref:Nudix family hydrolase n=1 Tax=unclassified Marinobacter TaxID=83889 RepID=UPI00200E7159|nr:MULTISPECIES: Nudix family hydrolase [unclassified Marinobacter]MCL1477022.1 Nudix family hydrolase [Marinobacter sp.]MCL1480792.1 Nudix family hydrolase [Marinobacter sp.]MCL1486289.1 Nudix family hydrolase [Marinobacter sp.]MCL1488479.1 Nudix family hydrolase [Marinobacter sp.]UQG56915.1 Nudix family hydrolase [Marinobacter sp. M4C]